MDPCIGACLCWIGCNLIGIGQTQRAMLKQLKKPEPVRMPRKKKTKDDEGKSEQ